MAIRGVCPDMACQLIENKLPEHEEKNKAFRAVARELGVKTNTVRSWFYRNEKKEDVANATRENPTKFPTCDTTNLEEIADSGIKFGTVYADPPWQYGNQGTRSATNNHYPTMTIPAICDLPVKDLVADDAHLHLWTTNAFLFEAKQVIESWGFTYKSCMVWVKPQMGIGNYWRVSHEFLLLGTRGRAPFSNRGIKSWQEVKRGAHSAKPPLFRHLIEKVSPGPYLELFGRKAIPHWTVWGNEIAKDLLTLPGSDE